MSKARQKDRLIREFGILTAPLAEMRCRADVPSPNDYRVALAKVQSADSKWRPTARAFATLADDVVMEAQYRDISHVPERFWGTFSGILNDPAMLRDLPRLKEEFDLLYDQKIEDFHEFVDQVPIDWEPMTFQANTPFTAYLRISEAVATARRRVYYFDRYLKPDFFPLFLVDLNRRVIVRLITTPNSIGATEPVARLAAREFADFQLIEVSPADIHDRNLIVDDQLFALGPGVDQAGTALTNFGPGDNSSIGQFEVLATGGRRVV